MTDTYRLETDQNEQLFEKQEVKREWLFPRGSGIRQKVQWYHDNGCHDGRAENKNKVHKPMFIKTGKANPFEK